MRIIEEDDTPHDVKTAGVTHKQNPWTVLEAMDELLEPFGLEIVQQDAGSDCIWHIEKRREVKKNEKKLAEEIDALKDEIIHLREALNKIAQWSEAYPISAFHEPSPAESHKAHELLKANGMTLDAFSASMGRHCTREIGNIAHGALKKK